jgi:hypothetical protein
MRSILDQAGVTWDVAVGKESYGNMVLLFSRRDHEEVRRAEISASSRLEAERMLRAFDPDSLRSKLAAASAWGAAPPMSVGNGPA